MKSSNVKEMEERKIKAEIDRISERIEDIMRNIEQAYPSSKSEPSGEDRSN